MERRHAKLLSACERSDESVTGQSTQRSVDTTVNQNNGQSKQRSNKTTVKQNNGQTKQRSVNSTVNQHN
jgi:hypothetical protein